MGGEDHERTYVGLIPTTFCRQAGVMMLPSVSVPRATAAKPIATATALPELEPSESPPGKNGLVDRPPLADQLNTLPLKSAHSDYKNELSAESNATCVTMLDFPNKIAPEASS